MKRIKRSVQWKRCLPMKEPNFIVLSAFLFLMKKVKCFYSNVQLQNITAEVYGQTPVVVIHDPVKMFNLLQYVGYKKNLVLQHHLPKFSILFTRPLLIMD